MVHQKLLPSPLCYNTCTMLCGMLCACKLLFFKSGHLLVVISIKAKCSIPQLVFADKSARQNIADVAAAAKVLYITIACIKLWYSATDYMIYDIRVLLQAGHSLMLLMQPWLCILVLPANLWYSATDYTIYTYIR